MALPKHLAFWLGWLDYLVRPRLWDGITTKHPIKNGFWVVGFLSLSSDF